MMGRGGITPPLIKIYNKGERMKVKIRRVCWWDGKRYELGEEVDLPERAVKTLGSCVEVIEKKERKTRKKKYDRGIKKVIEDGEVKEE